MQHTGHRLHIALLCYFQTETRLSNYQTFRKVWIPPFQLYFFFPPKERTGWCQRKLADNPNVVVAGVRYTVGYVYLTATPPVGNITLGGGGAWFCPIESQGEATARPRTAVVACCITGKTQMSSMISQSHVRLAARQLANNKAYVSYSQSSHLKDSQAFKILSENRK